MPVTNAAILPKRQGISRNTSDCILEKSLTHVTNATLNASNLVAWKATRQESMMKELLCKQKRRQVFQQFVIVWPFVLSRVVLSLIIKILHRLSKNPPPLSAGSLGLFAVYQNMLISWYHYTMGLIPLNACVVRLTIRVDPLPLPTYSQLFHLQELLIFPCCMLLLCHKMVR